MRRITAALHVFLIILLLAGCGIRELAGKGVPVAVTYGGIQTLALRFGVDINGRYIEALNNGGAQVVRLFVKDTDAEIGRKLSGVHGVLIPGGFDVEPVRYNEKNDPRLESVDGDLDRLEYRVLTYARDKNLPVLGICRGEQIINVFYSGSLYQDIPTLYRSTVKIPHRRQVDLWIYKHAKECLHDIHINKDSRLYELIGSEKTKVNSYHHQAVKELAPGFRIAARAMDGTVEAIEGTGNGFILATQFHPEMLAGEFPVFNGIFKAFIESVKAEKPAASAGR